MVAAIGSINVMVCPKYIVPAIEVTRRHQTPHALVTPGTTMYVDLQDE